MNEQTEKTITEEVLRHKVRELIARPKASKLQTIFNSTFTSIVVGFVLTGLIGSYLTASYSKEQQKVAAQRSFSDELNKIRIQRIGDMWQRIYENELAADDLVEESVEAFRLKSPNDNAVENAKRVEQIQGLNHESLKAISSNRFWLGEADYNTVRHYLDLNIHYDMEKIIGKGDDPDLLGQREKAKQDVLHLRQSFLKGDVDDQ